MAKLISSYIFDVSRTQGIGLGPGRNRMNYKRRDESSYLPSLAPERNLMILQRRDEGSK